MMTTIEVVISPTGESRIETKGFVGNSCRQASQFLEEALGAATGERLTAEYYRQPVSQVQKLSQEGGTA